MAETRSLERIDHDKIRIQVSVEAERRRRLTASHRAFIDRVRPNFKWWKHAQVLADVGTRIINGELKRVMVFVEPRVGKSEIFSRTLPAAYLMKHPTHVVGLASYGQDLANKMSRNARDNYERAGNIVREDVSGVQEWETKFGGGMWASGVGGPITGKGFNLGGIDDPLKNPQEAESRIIREGQIEWYETVWSTRREEDAAEYLVMTRWHPMDLAGYLLSMAEKQERSWHIVSLEAEKSAVPLKIPRNCTLEPDWRQPGQALCPEKFDENELAKIKKRISAKYWWAIYQQRPTIEEGQRWKREWFKNRTFKLGKQPPLMDTGKDWDCAYTKDDENSASGYIEAGRDAKGDIWVIGLDFRWYEFPQLVRWMVDINGPHYVEAKASGKSAVQTLKSYRIHAKEVQVEGGSDKLARVELASPAVEMGHVWIADHLIDTLLDDERQGILKFPDAEHTDINDAFTQMINRLFRREKYRWGFLGTEEKK